MKKFFLVIPLLFVSMVLTAASVSKEQARQQALSFVKGPHQTSPRGGRHWQAPANVALREVAVSSELYVFNVGEQDGFVIVSGDDCTGDLILGYADNGSFSADNMPENLKAWIKGYEKQIAWMKANGVTNSTAASRGIKRTVRQSVAPLLTCEWDQDEPYNNYCPLVWYNYTNAASELKNAATGCVATATAQILYYHGKRLGLPTTTTAKIPSYQSTDTELFCWSDNEHKSYYSLGNTVAEKPIRIFNWSKMANPLSDAEAAEEVARLMEYVGAGIEMQYNTSSGAHNEDVPAMLVNYFGYDSDAKTVYRDDYVYTDWIDAIYQELTTNGPVLYGGQSLGGGHAFVIDGYSEEDFFHVNWGWGGTSNGFYRMSALNPSEQGIGGSTSADGYNFGQCIMINVKPEDDGVSPAEDVRLTVTQFECPESERTFQRNGDSFGYVVGNTLYGILTNFTLYNLTGYANNFDSGFALYQGNEMISYVKGGTDGSIGNNGGFNGSDYLYISSDIPDGEYRIISVSRKTGTDTWLPSIDSDLFYIKATVSGDNMVLENISQDRTPELSGTLELSGDAVANSPVTIIAKLSNTGYQYIGSVKLIQKDGSNKYRLAERQIDVENGANNKEFEFSFTPDASGSWDLVLWNKENEVITGTFTTINVQAPASATTGTLSIANQLSNITFDNQVVGSYNNYRDGFYGSTLSGHVTVTNSHATLAHTSGIRVVIWQYNGNNYSKLTEKTYATNIAANGGTQQVNFSFSDLTVGTSYMISFHYPDGTEIPIYDYAFNSINGITTYLADGTETTIAPAASVVTPADAVVVDVSEINTVTTITPNSNPNTLYFVGASVPSGLTGKNVIQNGVAATLNLTDGYPFYTPKSFTAIEATYTRTFTNGADGTNGWNTIVLPFNVTQVKQGENIIDWFHSGSDTGKNFWLKGFVNENGAVVNFDYATQMNANTPYIIAMPGNKWGAKWDLTNKEITFCGSGVVAPMSSPSVSGNRFKFAGTYTEKTVNNSYALNNDGNNFVLADNTIDPFRAYFLPQALLGSLPKMLAIGSPTNQPTAIGSVTKHADSENAIYTLDGRRVSTVKHGVYIIDGKKVVK